VSPYDLAKFFRKGENKVEIQYWKELFPPFFKPVSRVRSMAFRAVSIFAGMIGVVERLALVALEDMSSKRFRAAFGNVPQCADVARKHSIPEPFQVLRAELPEDLGKLRHTSQPPGSLSPLELIHEVVDSSVKPVDRLFRQMCVDQMCSCTFDLHTYREEYYYERGRKPS